MSIVLTACSKPRIAGPSPLASAQNKALLGRRLLDAGVEKPPHVELDLATRRKMKIGPRRADISTLAFGKGRLGRLTPGGLDTIDTSRFTEVVHVAMGTVTGLVTMADGSFVATGRDGIYRLLPADDRARSFAPAPLTSGAALLPDRTNPDRFWVLPPGLTLLAYDAIASTDVVSLPAEWVDLPDYDRRALGSLRDGAFVYTTDKDMQRFYGEGEHQKLSISPDGVFQLLPGSRPDTVWVARHDRTVTLYLLVGDKATRLTRVKLEEPAFEMAAAGKYLASLELREPDDAPWRFVLEVFDVGGRRDFRVELPADESLGEDWLARLVRDRNLAVSADPDFVAVGGPTSLDVFEIATGRRVFSGGVPDGGIVQ